MTEAKPLEPALREGEIIAGKYRIQHVLGEGGMGCVVSARHLLLNQDVAIKFLLPAAARDPQYVERFFREARAAAAMKSEHVVRVIDVGTLDGGMPYMVMEHLAGIDLAARVQQRGPLPVEEAINYTLQACEALAEAHAVGLVHRDIKPSNLFLTRRTDGSPLVKLLDFGIAKAVSAVDGALTATGAVMGSPNYMSPEQIRSAKTVDARSDIWSLGATLHELLTGMPPFVADTFWALCAAIVTDPPVRLGTLRPDAASGLQAVILRCLEKDPARRFPSVAALAHELAPFAPPQARLSVDRVSKILLLGREASHTAPEDGGSVPRISVAPRAAMAASPLAETTATTGATVQTSSTRASAHRSRSRLAIPIGIAGALAAFTIALVVSRGGRAPEPEVTPTAEATNPKAAAASKPSSGPVVDTALKAPTALPDAPSASPLSVSTSNLATSASAGGPAHATSSRPRALPASSPSSRTQKPRYNVDPFADQH
jgi:serine/threonine-protein kinase